MIEIWTSRRAKRSVETAWQIVDQYRQEALDAYRQGYNDHARAVQHWQDTHGAYRQHGEGENP